jgi:hypothetical protein
MKEAGLVLGGMIYLLSACAWVYVFEALNADAEADLRGNL